jgi:hypothetical protein
MIFVTVPCIFGYDIAMTYTELWFYPTQCLHLVVLYIVTVLFISTGFLVTAAVLREARNVNEMYVGSSEV